MNTQQNTQTPRKEGKSYKLNTAHCCYAVANFSLPFRGGKENIVFKCCNTF